MKLRTRLALQYTFIVGSLIFISSLITYFLFVNFQHENYNSRLERKAVKAAARYNDPSISNAMLFHLEKYSDLNNAKVLIYDQHDSLVFTTDTTGGF
ncbi:MAG: hypothetical protein WCI97_08190 [Bacteroidota bacterium]